VVKVVVVDDGRGGADACGSGFVLVAFVALEVVVLVVVVAVLEVEVGAFCFCAFASAASFCRFFWRAAINAFLPHRSQ